MQAGLGPESYLGPTAVIARAKLQLHSLAASRPECSPQDYTSWPNRQQLLAVYQAPEVRFGAEHVLSEGSPTIVLISTFFHIHTHIYINPCVWMHSLERAAFAHRHELVRSRWLHATGRPFDKSVCLIGITLFSRQFQLLLRAASLPTKCIHYQWRPTQSLAMRLIEKEKENTHTHTPTLKRIANRQLCLRADELAVLLLLLLFL